MQIKLNSHEIVSILGKAMGWDVHTEHVKLEQEPTGWSLVFDDLSVQELAAVVGISKGIPKKVSVPLITDDGAAITEIQTASQRLAASGLTGATPDYDPEDHIVLRQPASHNESYDPPPFDPAEIKAQ